MSIAEHIEWNKSLTMYVLALLAKKTYAPFNSWASAILCPGIISNHLFLLSGGCTSKTAYTISTPNFETLSKCIHHLLSVSMKPGLTQFTLAKSTHSTAKLFAKCTTAALLAL